MTKIFWFVALALTAGVFFIVLQFTSGDKDKGLPLAQPQVLVKEVPTTDVYVAKQDIPIGAILEPEMLDIQPWPSHLVLEDMVKADPSKPSDIVKMVVRTPFLKGEPIIRHKLANDKDPSFLAAQLPKGFRLVTIGVDPVSGVAGFVFPGDRVDVLVTHDLELGKQADSVPLSQPQSAANGSNAPAAPLPPKKDPVTEVLLSNVLVMAINQKATAHGGEPPVQPSMISLAVAPGDVQKIRLTENGNGRLSLALRSLKDKDDAELARPTGLGDLSRLTSPAYFPVLYDANGQPSFISPAAEADAKDQKAADDQKTSIKVTRGVKEEAVEVTRP